MSPRSACQTSRRQLRRRIWHTKSGGGGGGASSLSSLVPVLRHFLMNALNLSGSFKIFSTHFLFIHPFNNIGLCVCWCRSVGRSVLYNLGELCACVLAVSAMAQPPTRLLLIEMDWGKAPLSCPSLLTHTSVVNTHATLHWLSPFLFCSFCSLTLWNVPFTFLSSPFVSEI